MACYIGVGSYPGYDIPVVFLYMLNTQLNTKITTTTTITTIFYKDAKVACLKKSVVVLVIVVIFVLKCALSLHKVKHPYRQRAASR